MRIIFIIAIAILIIHLIIKYDKFKKIPKLPAPKNNDNPITKQYSLNNKQIHDDIAQIDKKLKQAETNIELSKAITQKKPLNDNIIQLDIMPKTNEKVLWTHELLFSLEWKRYEQLCNAWLIMQGYKAQLTKIGADGGIDINVFDNGGNIIAIAQCKAWQQKVSVNLLREFYGIMASEKINRGFYFTTSHFSQDAMRFCNGKGIDLITGHYLINSIHKLSDNEQKQLYQLATDGDYKTPTCPQCDIKMLKRSSAKGDFWGCRNYPKCKNILNMRKQII